MSALIGLVRRLAALPVLLASAALFAMMVMTFADVVLRSAFDAPIEQATELTRIFLAVAVFAVLPVISARREGHIAVDLSDPLFDRLGLARFRDGLLHVAGGVLLLWPVQRMVVLAERSAASGDVTEYLRLPQAWVEGFIAAATGLTALVMVATGLLMWLAPRLLEAPR